MSVYPDLAHWLEEVLPDLKDNMAVWVVDHTSPSEDFGTLLDKLEHMSGEPLSDLPKVDIMSNFLFIFTSGTTGTREQIHSPVFTQRTDGQQPYTAQKPQLKYCRSDSIEIITTTPSTPYTGSSNSIHKQGKQNQTLLSITNIFSFKFLSELKFSGAINIAMEKFSALKIEVADRYESSRKTIKWTLG